MSIVVTVSGSHKPGHDRKPQKCDNPDYNAALTAWRAKAQATVDNAQMRYFVVHLHKLLEPEPR